MNVPRAAATSRSFFPVIKAPHAPRVFSSLSCLAVVVGSIVVATLVKLQLETSLGSYAPFLLYFFAVIVSAWCGGLASGLLSTILSASLYYFYFAPQTFHENSLQRPIWTAIYCLEALVISLLIARMRDLQMSSVLTARALKDSEERYKRVLDTAFEGIWIADAQGRTTYINQHVVEMLGYSYQEILGRPALDFVAEEDRALALQQQQNRREGERSQYEFPMTRKNGTKLWTLISSAPLHDENGKFQGGLAMITDISALKKAEYSLVESENRYRNFVAQSTEAIWCFEADQPISPQLDEAEQIDLALRFGYLTECNDAMARMYGYDTASNLVGAKMGDLMPTPENQDYLRNFIRSGYRLVDAETEERDRDGNTKYFLNNLVGEMNANGALCRAWGVQRDITALKHAELEREKLLESEREARFVAEQLRSQAERARLRWEFLADASALMADSGTTEEKFKCIAERAVKSGAAGSVADWCLIDFINDDGTLRRVAIANRDAALCEMAWEISRLLDEQNGARAPQGMQTAIDKRETCIFPNITDEILQASAKSPELLQMLRALNIRSYLYAPLLSRDRVLGVLSFGVSEDTQRFSKDDIAFGNSLARRLALAIDNEELLFETQEANRTKDQFLATLSHELRTPLNAILGWSHLLNSGKLEGESLKNATETIERNARLQTQLVEDLLDLSRISGGRMKIDNEPVSLDLITQQAIDTVCPAAQAKNISIEYSNAVDVSKAGATCVRGDERRLQQIAWNLLSNALKFTPQGGRVEVSLHRDHDELQLQVRDSGQGIEADFLPHVWEQFRQADASSTRRTGGMGLGLSIVKSMAELHGGRVEVRSEGKDQGSVFSVYLPAIKTESAADA